MTNPRVLLTTLSVRTSVKGRRHLVSKALVVAFKSKPESSATRPGTFRQPHR
jgi:hypothetical protein